MLEPVAEGNTVAHDKAALRAEFRALLRAVPPLERARQSTAASERLLTQPVWQQAQTVLLYWPLQDELDLAPLFRAALDSGKTLALPRFEVASASYAPVAIQDPAADLVPGKYGIREPASHCPGLSIKALDLAVVPGLCFGMNGPRLGRGQGYYDRLLTQATALKCGVGYDFQVLPEVPADTFDVALDFVLTPVRWLELKQRPVLK